MDYETEDEKGEMRPLIDLLIGARAECRKSLILDFDIGLNV